MNMTALALLVLNYVLIVSLPFVFFERGGHSPAE